MKGCAVDGCSSAARSRGWCNPHYQRWYKWGDPTIDRTRRAQPCRSEGCTRLSFGLGLCANHYKQVQYQRNPDKYRAWERRRRVEHADAVRAKDRERHRANPWKARVASINRKAQTRGAEGRHTTAEWLARLAEYGGRCAYCGRPGTTRDHVIPLSRGGSNRIDNIVPACLTCNLRKNAKTGDEFRALLAAEHLLRLDEADELMEKAA